MSKIDRTKVFFSDNDGFTVVSSDLRASNQNYLNAIKIYFIRNKKFIPNKELVLSQ